MGKAKVEPDQERATAVLDETIKTARNVHRAIMVLSSTMLLTWFIPVDSEKYSQGLKSLETLELASRHLAAYEKTVGYYTPERSELKKEILDIVQEKVGEIGSSKVIYSFEPSQLISRPQVPSNGSCQQIREYLVSRPQSRVFMFNEHAVVAVSKKPDNRSDEDLRGVKFDKVEIGPLVRFEDGRAFILASLSLEDAEIIQFTLTGIFEEFEYWETDYFGYLASLDSSAIKMREAAKLISSPDTERQALNGLDEFWDDIRGRNIDDSFIWLADLRRKSEKEIELLGFSVQAKSAIIIGPILISILQFYLLSYVQTIHRQIIELNLSERQFYPWVTLFRSKAGALIGYFSACILPMVSVFLLGVRIIQPPLGIETFLISLIPTLVAVFTFFSVLSLRKSMMQLP